MRDHIRILGILNIVMGGLTVAGGFFVLVVMGGVASLMAFSNDGHADPDTTWMAPLVGVIGMAIAAFLTAVALPTIIGGWGLLKYKSWSRVLMLIISGLNLLHVPFGTALGIYGLWVLTNDQSRQLLETGGAMPAQPFQMQQQPAGSPPQAF